jgi:hypothetical protein
MTSEMRFGEKVKSGNAAGLRELVPYRLAYYTQCKSRDHLFADTTNCFDIAKQFSRTTLGVDQPLSAKIHMNDGEVSIRTVTGYKVRLLRASLELKEAHHCLR